MVDIFNSVGWNIFLAIIAIGAIIYAMYSSIKYKCLEEACKKVASIERMTDLTGEQKFALVVTWINNDLPKIFKNTLIQNVIKVLVQKAYDNCFKYAKNYIKRKTGLDISEIVTEVQNKENNNTQT